MAALVEPIKRGFTKSLSLLLMLTKIIVPVTILVAVLDHFGIVENIAHFFSPAMALLGLPGEATIILLLGFFINLYAALGVIAAISLSPQQLTVLALMLGICHELPVETMVCRYTGLPVPVSALLRIVTAFIAGFALHLTYTLFGGG